MRRACDDLALCRPSIFASASLSPSALRRGLDDTCTELGSPLQYRFSFQAVLSWRLSLKEAFEGRSFARQIGVQRVDAACQRIFLVNNRDLLKYRGAQTFFHSATSWPRAQQDNDLVIRTPFRSSQTDELLFLKLLNGCIGIVETNGIRQDQEGRIITYTPRYEQDLTHELNQKQRFPQKPHLLLKAAWQLLRGATEIAKIGCHCDLKTDNILVREVRGHFEVAIADFGLALTHARAKTHKKVGGTWDWLAPELLRAIVHKEDLTGRRTEAADVWSMGMIFFCLFQRPARDPSHQALSILPWMNIEEKLKPSHRLKLMETTARPKDIGAFSSVIEDPPLRSFVESMLALDPAQRPTFAALLQQFERAIYNPVTKTARIPLALLRPWKASREEGKEPL